MDNKIITLNNKRIITLLEQKKEFFQKLKKIDEDIQEINKQIAELEEKEKEITTNIEPPEDLKAKGDELVEKINAMYMELTDISNQITELKKAGIDKEIADKHYALLDERKEKEKEGQKLSLHIQKIKDKVVPLIRKEIKPLLGEFEDPETAYVEEGKVLVPVTDRLEEWKKIFLEKKNK